MKRIQFLIRLLLAVLAIPVYSCKNAGPDTPPDYIDVPEHGGSGSSDGQEPGLVYDYEYGEKTVEITPEMEKSVTDASYEGFSMPGDKYGVSTIKEGDVVVFPSSEEYPGGYAARVTGFNLGSDGKTYRYETTQAALTEVFENLHIEQTGLDISGAVQKIIDSDGNEIPFTKAGAGFEIAIPDIFGINGLGIDINDNVSISPSAKIKFNLEMAVDIIDFKLAYAKARVDAEAHLGADITVKAGKDKKWTSKQLQIMVGAIPVGPIIITPTVFVEFELKLSGEVNLTFTVNYQKAYYAFAYYDGQEVHAKAGEGKIADKKDPFAVTGNLSGGIEFGPNMGVEISIYRGALGIGVDFDPHLCLGVTASYPFKLENLENSFTAGRWLSDAYYEPSLSFKFGGFVELAYAWRKEFKVPDNLSLTYSFGKTFIMPKLGSKFDVKVSGHTAILSTTIKNKSIFTDGMFVRILQGSNSSGRLVAEVPFIIPKLPAEEDDEVPCMATFTDIQDGIEYYIDGPYMRFSALGHTADILMEPSQKFNRTLRIVNPQVERAVRGLLEDLLSAREGTWDGCNWDDPDAGLNTWTNVFFFRHSDEDAAQHEGADWFTRNEVFITLPDSWKTSSTVTIGSHTANLAETVSWKILAAGRTFGTLVINDPNYEGDMFVCTEKFAVHSPRFDTAQIIFDADYPLDEVDLSGSGVKSLTLYDYKQQASYSGVLILDNCASLQSISLNFPNFQPIPSRLSFQNCPKFERIYIHNGQDLSVLSAYTGHCTKLSLYGPNGGNPVVGDICDEIEGQECFYESFTLTGNRNITEIRSYGSSTGSGFDCRNLVIDNCPSLQNVECNSGVTESVSISNCPSLKSFRCCSSDLRSGPLSYWSISGSPDIRVVQISSSILSGTVPETITTCFKNGGTATYPYKYTYKSDFIDGKWKWVVDKTYPNGYYYPGEPGKAYNHYEHKWYDGN